MNKTYKITINHKNGSVNRPNATHFFSDKCKEDFLKRVKKEAVLGEIGYPGMDSLKSTDAAIARYCQIQEDRVVIRITNAHFHKSNGIITIWFQFVNGHCKEWLEQEFIQGRSRPGIRGIGFDTKNTLGEPAFVYEKIVTLDFIEKP